MSDDLVKRLQEYGPRWVLSYPNTVCEDAAKSADRIETLQAQLTTARADGYAQGVREAANALASCHAHTPEEEVLVYHHQATILALIDHPAEQQQKDTTHD